MWELTGSVGGFQEIDSPHNQLWIMDGRKRAHYYSIFFFLGETQYYSSFHFSLLSNGHGIQIPYKSNVS